MRQRLRILIVLFAAFAAALPLLGDDGGDSRFEFTGTIESLPASGFFGDWTVSGLTVHVGAATELEQSNGILRLGDVVRVRGTLLADGSVLAEKIEVEEEGNPVGNAVRFTAIVESMPASGFVGTWSIGGRTVRVSAATRVDETNGVPMVGSTVEVSGTAMADGSVDALQIEVRAPAPGGGGGTTGQNTDVSGLVESLPSGSPPLGDWVVGGRTVHVTAATVLDAPGGTFAVGAFVEVEGTANADGSITATKVELHRNATPPSAAKASFRGAVELLASTPGWIGDWRVAGRAVVVTAATEIEQEHGTLAVGSLVEVLGTAQAGGAILADRIEVEWGPASSGASLTNTWILPSSARVHGKDDAFFTTDLTISNTGAAAADVRLRFLGHERDGRTGPERSFSIAAGATVSFEDVLGTLFGLGDDFGAILVTSNVATLVVESATSTPGAGGEFGQGLSATRRNELVGDDHPRSLVGIRDDGRFRTNLVLTNAVEKPIDVDLNLFGDDGRRLGSLRVHLEALGMRQVGEVSRAVGATGDVSSARLVVSTPTSGGAFAAYASVIDDGTNDPRVLSPR